MSRYRAIYDEKGKMYAYQDGVCVFVREDLLNQATSTNPSYTIQPDLPDFVSPIDGTIVSGRAGLREHCIKHNVVPTEELKGLPMKKMQEEHTSSKEYREAMKRAMHEIINNRNYK